MILAFVLILALGSVEYATGACDVCSSVSRAKCMSETTFKMCRDPATPGEPLEEDPNSPIIHCPSPKHCSEHEAICIPTGTPTCINKCGKCNDKKVFACVSETKFAFCFGETHPSAGYIGTCPTGQHCNIDEVSGYCAATGKATCLAGDEQFPTTVTPPTTATTPTTASTPTTATTPTTRPTSSPTDYCKTRPSGRYPVAGSSCTKYIYCYAQGGSIVGKQYTCPPSNVFNPDLQRCVMDSSYPCPGNI